MELYKENLIHKIEDDLAGRNKNWEALENHIKNISDEYDPAKTYQIGDYAIYENTLYRCISETNGEWDSSAWVATSVAAEIVAHKAEDAQKHITESGENANGRYVRFDDGTQMCIGSGTFTIPTMTQFTTGLWRTTNPGNFYFPASFTEVYFADLRLYAGEVISCNMRGLSVSHFNTTIIAYDDLSSRSVNYHLLGIGRWK